MFVETLPDSHDLVLHLSFFLVFLVEHFITWAWCRFPLALPLHNFTLLRKMKGLLLFRGFLFRNIISAFPLKLTFINSYPHSVSSCPSFTCSLMPLAILWHQRFAPFIFRSSSHHSSWCSALVRTMSFAQNSVVPLIWVFILQFFINQRCHYVQYEDWALMKTYTRRWVYNLRSWGTLTSSSLATMFVPFLHHLIK